MVQTYAFRERRNAVAAWLRDRYGPGPGELDEEMPDAAYWRDASDFLKFLTANGFTIQPTEVNE